VYLSPFLVAEQDLGGLVRDEIREGLDEQRESRLKIHAIGCEDDVMFVWNGWWEWVTPGMREEGKKKRRKGVMMVFHSRPRKPKGGAKRVKHQFSSATLTIDERELSCTFWRMMSRRGLVWRDGRGAEGPQRSE
jgi:hypothetical protein